MIQLPSAFTIVTDGNKSTVVASCDDSQTSTRGSVTLQPVGADGQTPDPNAPSFVFLAPTHADEVEAVVSLFENGSAQIKVVTGDGSASIAVEDAQGNVIASLPTSRGSAQTTVALDPQNPATVTIDGTGLHITLNPAPAGTTGGAIVDWSLTSTGKDGNGNGRITVPVTAGSGQ